MAFAGDASTETVQHLTDQARRRGPDSFGIALLNADGDWEVKRQRTASWPEALAIEVPAGARAGIAQARLATSGSFADAQPLMVGDMVFAHNGTVYDHRRLADRFDLEMSTGNDSEVLARLWRLFRHNFDLTLGALEQHQGKTPHAWIAGVGSTIWIASFGQPLYYRDSMVCSWRFPDSVRLEHGSVMFWEV